MSKRSESTKATFTRRVFGSDFDASELTSAECVSEINGLRRHLRSIHRSDKCEIAETLACIAQVRVRQLAIANKEAAVAQVAALKEEAEWSKIRSTSEPNNGSRRRADG